MGLETDERGDPARRRPSLKYRLVRSSLLGAVGLVVVYAVMMAVVGSAGLVEALAGLNPSLLILPLISTLLSYITMSFSYEAIARLAGSSIRSLDMLRITFVANAANYIFPTGGLSGFALRIVMLNKRGVSAGRSVLISFTQTLITNFMLMAFVAYGLVHLMATRELRTGGVVAACLVVVGVVVLVGGAILMMYRRSLRNRFLGWCDRCSSRVLDTLGKRESHGRRVSRVLVHVNEGMEFLASQPLGMVVPIFWIFLDWLLTLGILYAAFFSVGYPVSVSQVAVGFSVSLVVAIMSLVPAGVGVLEATMAATFLTVGVPLKVSVLPIVIFRICYYVIPVIMALVLAPRAFADAEGSVGELMT